MPSLTGSSRCVDVDVDVDDDGLFFALVGLTRCVGGACCLKASTLRFDLFYVSLPLGRIADSFGAIDIPLAVETTLI